LEPISPVFQTHHPGLSFSLGTTIHIAPPGLFDRFFSYDLFPKLLGMAGLAYFSVFAFVHVVLRMAEIAIPPERFNFIYADLVTF
jgi:hypothetical protein